MDLSPSKANWGCFQTYEIDEGERHSFRPYLAKQLFLAAIVPKRYIISMFRQKLFGGQPKSTGNNTVFVGQTKFKSLALKCDFT